MEETKRCPYCGEEILAVAKKCKHCGEWLEQKDTSKEKKACPVCGEMIDVDFQVCPYCKEPINCIDNAEALSEPSSQEALQPKTSVFKTEMDGNCKNYIKLAFGVVVLGTILTFATDCAELYATKVGGLIGLFVGLGHSVPSWVGACLDGIGSLYILWFVADSIMHQTKAEGRDDITYLLLKVLSILYVVCNIIAIDEDGVVPRFFSFLLYFFMGIFMAVNGFLLKSEKDPMLSNIGKAFIANLIIGIVMIRVSLQHDFNASAFLWLILLNDITWICAMFVAHKYLLNKNK